MHARVQDEDQYFLLTSSRAQLHLGQIRLENCICDIPESVRSRAGVYSWCSWHVGVPECCYMFEIWT